MKKNRVELQNKYNMYNTWTEAQRTSLVFKTLRIHYHGARDSKQISAGYEILVRNCCFTYKVQQMFLWSDLSIKTSIYRSGGFPHAGLSASYPVCWENPVQEHLWDLHGPLHAVQTGARSPGAPHGVPHHTAQRWETKNNISVLTIWSTSL